MTDTARWKATVYVGGLGPQATTANVFDAFIPFGDIADVTLPKSDRHAKQQRTNGVGDDAAGAGPSTEHGADPDAEAGHRGFAYVEYEDADDAKEAIDNMDKSEFFGRTLKVTAAKAPKSTNEGLGSRTALWNQVSFFSRRCFVQPPDVLLLTYSTGVMACAECSQRGR